MIMWAVLMGVLFILAFAGILYLSNRIGHFSFFRNLAHGKKRLAMFYGFLVTAVFTAAIWFLWGSMNAIVCVLHLLIFWLISDGIFSFIKKHRGGLFPGITQGSQPLFLLYVTLALAGIWRIMCGRKITRSRQRKK